VLASGTWWVRSAGARPGDPAVDAASGQGAAGSDVDVDLVSGGELYQGITGAVRNLAATGEVAIAPARVPFGYVYRSAGSMLRLVTFTGLPIPVGELPADTYAVSSDGGRLAWIRDTDSAPSLQVAPVTVAGVGEAQQTTVPDGARVLGFIGRYVVLGDGQKSERYDVWNPAAAFTPTWRSGITAFLGADNSGAFGLVADLNDGTCLIRLVPMPSGLEEAGRRCGLMPAGTGPVLAGLGGHLALARGRTVTVVDPEAVFTGGQARGRCELAGDVQSVIWADPIHVFAMTGLGPRLCDAETGTVRTLPAPPPATSGQPWLPVPTYGNR